MHNCLEIEEREWFGKDVCDLFVAGDRLDGFVFCDRFNDLILCIENEYDNEEARLEEVDKAMMGDCK
jgi:hypothetical protein